MSAPKKKSASVEPSPRPSSLEEKKRLGGGNGTDGKKGGMVPKRFDDEGAPVFHFRKEKKEGNSTRNKGGGLKLLLGVGIRRSFPFKAQKGATIEDATGLLGGMVTVFVKRGSHRGGEKWSTHRHGKKTRLKNGFIHTHEKKKKKGGGPLVRKKKVLLTRKTTASSHERRGGGSDNMQRHGQVVPPASHHLV